jgi:thrombospondin 2/3/4/5
MVLGNYNFDDLVQDKCTSCLVYSDACDNCPKDANPDQADDDEDTFGNLCDTNDDKDQDGIPDSLDNCVNVANADQQDTDSDKMGDECDSDIDNDGLVNELDNCMLAYNPQQEDTDRDGKGDICQVDFDVDGTDDYLDTCPNNSRIYATDFRYSDDSSITFFFIENDNFWCKFR